MEEVLKKVVVNLLEKSETKLPKDVIDALKAGYEMEDSQVSKMQFKAILDNIKLSEETGIPMCQDTGVPLFFVKLPNYYFGDVERAVREGVLEATEKVPLRPNAVHPITRKNPGTNVGERMPYVTYELTDNDFIEISAIPKGAGSENMSRLGMLNPSQGVKGIKEFVLETLVKAGGKPCPPLVLGVGVGGSADIAMKLAKMALLRPLKKRHPDSEIAKLEEELLKALNELGIGAMGLGGKTTVMGVMIEYAFCHTASLPVAVNIQCWGSRVATARIFKDGKVEYLEVGE